MGEIADMLLDGTLDFYTGEYIGRSIGMPRTLNHSLPWERQRKKRESKCFTTSKDVAYSGIRNYIAIKWSGRKNIPSVRSVIYEYTGESNFDLKLKCLEIQKDFRPFAKFINKKTKENKQ